MPKPGNWVAVKYYKKMGIFRSGIPVGGTVCTVLMILLSYL